MSTQSVLALIFTTFAAAVSSSQTADNGIEYIVSLFDTNTTCDLVNGSLLASGPGTFCANFTLPKGGSAKVLLSTASKHGYVTGYSEENCTGDVLVVFTTADGCIAFPDFEVKSWIGQAPFPE